MKMPRKLLTYLAGDAFCGAAFSAALICLLTHLPDVPQADAQLDEHDGMCMLSSLIWVPETAGAAGTAGAARRAAESPQNRRRIARTQNRRRIWDSRIAAESRGRRIAALGRRRIAAALGQRRSPARPPLAAPLAALGQHETSNAQLSCPP
jgi:hypothetical protein